MNTDFIEIVYVQNSIIFEIFLLLISVLPVQLNVNICIVFVSFFPVNWVGDRKLALNLQPRTDIARALHHSCTAKITILNHGIRMAHFRVHPCPRLRHRRRHRINRIELLVAARRLKRERLRQLHDFALGQDSRELLFLFQLGVHLTRFLRVEGNLEW